MRRRLQPGATASAAALRDQQRAAPTARAVHALLLALASPWAHHFLWMTGGNERRGDRGHGDAVQGS